MRGYHLNSDGSWFIAPAPHEPGDNGSTFLNAMEEDVRKEGSEQSHRGLSIQRGREGGRPEEAEAHFSGPVHR